MPEQPPSPEHPDATPDPYAGRWVARLGDRLVGQGGTPQQALQAAKAARFKEKPKVSYVPTGNPLSFSPLLEQVRDCVSKRKSIYLVGGAVRDALLNNTSHDLDFAVPGDALKVARKVANALHGAYYSMDDDHGTGRVVLTKDDGNRQILDFASLRGEDLDSDLRGRDFTVNAMAVDIRQPQELLDPLGGTADLAAGRLRACTSTSFTDDPVRILRAVRLAAGFKLHILPETRQQMRASVDQLPTISPERLRDELFRILDTPQPATSIRALDILDMLPHLLPELPALKGITQPSPHVSDVWTHTLHTLQNLENILNALDESYDPETASEFSMGMVVLRLGRYREQITAHVNAHINPERRLRPLLFLAALYHDAGKPATRSENEDGRIQFLGHEGEGAKVVASRAAALRLSNVECERLKTIVSNHMRPFHLTKTGNGPSRRAVYRFFRDTGSAGVDVILLSLADLLATYNSTLPQDALTEHLEVLRTLSEAWWEQPQESVSPPALLNGKDLLKTFDLEPGPLIGQLLEALREAQAAGEISNREEALEFTGQFLEDNEIEE